MYNCSESSRSKRNTNNDAIVKFNLADFTSDPGAVLVHSAVLTVNLRESVGEGAGRVCAVQVVEGEDGIQLGCEVPQLLEDGGGRVQLDISHALQAWLMDPLTDKGVLIQTMSSGLEIDPDRPPVIMTESVSGLVVRQRRDIFLSSEVYAARPGRTDCAAKGSTRRCCRQSMNVQLRDLQVEIIEDILHIINISNFVLIFKNNFF